MCCCTLSSGIWCVVFELVKGFTSFFLACSCPYASCKDCVRWGHALPAHSVLSMTTTQLLVGVVCVAALWVLVLDVLFLNLWEDLLHSILHTAIHMHHGKIKLGEGMLYGPIALYLWPQFNFYLEMNVLLHSEFWYLMCCFWTCERIYFILFCIQLSICIMERII